MVNKDFHYCTLKINQTVKIGQIIWKDVQYELRCSWLKMLFPFKNAPELTARQLGCIFWHPSNRVSKNAPEFTGRELGPWTRAVNSGSGNRA